MLNKLLVFFAALLCVCAATAQQADKVMVNFQINHGAAYRDGSWATVDVYVDNKGYDIKGVLEVRTFSITGDLQSPVHQLPVESPNQSTKRFRLYVYLHQCSRVEVQLYNGRRRVLDVPAFMQVTPIRKEDYLSLILDDAPEGYSFLSTELFKSGQNTRFYRENLDTNRLAYLSDRLQSYEPFNLIVLGNIDPERIAPQHRDLLRQYVERGGTLVVSTGDHAARYRGTWVEEFAGVRIGEQRLLKGAEFAAEVFDSEDANGALMTRETLVPALERTVPGVLRLGKGSATLATMRRLGGGQVAVIAVDADSRILQTCDGYLKLWRELAGRGQDRLELNFAEALALSAATLPRVAGVELAPVTSVIGYLATYFILAIVLNWLFWNYMRRREMAWVCLVFFSVGFTAYAMVFGTQGRARSSELEQVEILRMTHSTPIAQYTSFTGVLAQGTGSFSGTLTRPNALLYEPKTTQAQFNPYERIRSGAPLNFVQDEPGRFDNLRVGASEMRFIVNNDYVRLDGVVEGAVRVQGAKLGGTLRNKTGLKLRNPMLFVQGKFYRLGDGDEWDLEQARLHNEMNRTNRPYYGYYDPYNNPVQDLAAFERELTMTLLMQFDHNQYQRFMPANLPPLFIAWTEREPFGGMALDIDAAINIKTVMLLAELPVGLDASGEPEPPTENIILPVGNWQSGWEIDPDRFTALARENTASIRPGWIRLHNNGNARIEMDAIPWNANAYTLELHLFYSCAPEWLPKFADQIKAEQLAGEQDPTAQHLEKAYAEVAYVNGEILNVSSTSEVHINVGGLENVPYVHEIYEIKGWERQFSGNQFANVRLGLRPVWKPDTPRDVQRRPHAHFPFYLLARLVPQSNPTAYTTQEGAVAWQQ